MQFRLQQEMLLSAIDAASGATSLASYFPAVRERAESASAAAGKTDLYFRIGGRIVRMRFAGTSLAPIVVPSIEHLSVSPSVSVDLTIHLWDQHSTGVGVPRPGWNLDRYGPLCQIEEEGQHLIFNPSSRTLHMYDAAAREGYFWVVSPKQLPAWEMVCPLRPLLGWWARYNRQIMVHAAAVGLGDDGETPSRGVLLAGRSGSGKSTTALASLQKGLTYLGDDYVLVDQTDQPTVYGVYNSGKLTPENLQQRLPTMKNDVRFQACPNQDKSMLLLRDRYASLLGDQLPLRAIVLPRVGDTGQTKLQRISSTQTLRRLAATTLFQLPGDSPAVFKAMGQLACRLPGYDLQLGTNLTEVVGVIRNLLEGAVDAKAA